MDEAAETENLWGTRPRRPPPGGASARAIGRALLAIAQPDLFGHVADPQANDRLAALRRRRLRARLHAAAGAILAEPWSIDDSDQPRDAVALARRFLRRHPERDRADPTPPLLTDRQEAALWHCEETMVEELCCREPR